MSVTCCDGMWDRARSTALPQHLFEDRCAPISRYCRASRVTAHHLHAGLAKLRTLSLVPPLPILVEVAEVRGTDVVDHAADVAAPLAPVAQPPDVRVDVRAASLAPYDALAREREKTCNSRQGVF